jgi:hypothetical protein
MKTIVGLRRFSTGKVIYIVSINVGIVSDVQSTNVNVLMVRKMVDYNLVL